MNPTNIHPVGPCVLVEMLLDQELISSVIVLPDADERIKSANRGRVIEISPYAFRDWFDGIPWVKVGDTVLLKKYSGINKTIDKKIYRVVEDKDFWAVEDQPTEVIK